MTDTRTGTTRSHHNRYTKKATSHHQDPKPRSATDVYQPDWTITMKVSDSRFLDSRLSFFPGSSEGAHRLPYEFPLILPREKTAHCILFRENKWRNDVVDESERVAAPRPVKPK